MSALKELQERLEKLQIMMEDRDRKVEWVCMTRGEVEALLDMMEEPETAEEPKKAEDFMDLQSYGKGYMDGCEFGYKQALKDVTEKLGRMQWYGGNKSKISADGVPEHHAGRAADLQHEL